MLIDQCPANRADDYFLKPLSRVLYVAHMELNVCIVAAAIFSRAASPLEIKYSHACWNLRLFHTRMNLVVVVGLVEQSAASLRNFRIIYVCGLLTVQPVSEFGLQTPCCELCERVTLIDVQKIVAA
jgi:hypothetical protein